MKNVSEIMFRWCLTYETVCIHVDMDSADPQNRSESLSGEDVFEEDLSKSPTLGRGKRALKRI